MAERVRLIQGRVRLEKEEPKNTSTRVRLNPEVVQKTSSRVRLEKSGGRVRLQKNSAPETRYYMSQDKPHLHTRIVAEMPKQDETIYWMKVPQPDGKILYDRLVVKKDNAASRRLLNATSTYGLAAQYKAFQGPYNQWIPPYLKAAKARGWA